MAYAFSSSAALALILAAVLALVWFTRLSAKRPNAMSCADITWSRMDTPANPMMATAVMMFDEPLDFERLKQQIESRLLTFARFRQRVIHDRGRHYWEDDPDFDLDFHVRRLSLPAGADQQALQELTGQLMSAPLDFARPLWEWYLVENYGQGCAVIFKAHHCIADGIALVRIFLAMSAPGARGQQDYPELAARAFRATAAPQGPTRWLTALRRGIAFLPALGKQLLLGPDARTILRGRVGGQKRAAWSPPLSLPELKRLGRQLGGQVNDVMLTAIAGALGRYLQDHGGGPAPLAIRLIIPVSLRPFQPTIELGNRFATVFLELPLGIQDPIERFHVICRRMNRIKRSREAAVNDAILQIMGLMPDRLEKLALKFFGLKATAVMTNVPGPTRPVCIAGRPMRNAIFWVPQIASIGLGLSVFSYRDQITLGVTTDSQIMADPGAMVSACHEEIRELIRLAKLSADPPPAP